MRKRFDYICTIYQFRKIDKSFRHTKLVSPATTYFIDVTLASSLGYFSFSFFFRIAFQEMKVKKNATINYFIKKIVHQFVKLV